MRSLLFVALLTPALAGCIAGDAAERSDLPDPGGASFSVGAFIQELEKTTTTSFVNAQVESLQVEYNQSRVTLVEWRSFTPTDEGCDLVSTMVYQANGRTGGFLVDQQGEPCPVALQGTPRVAEVVALVDRVTLPMVAQDVLEGAPIFSISLAGYCGYTADADGDPLYLWNGAGLTERNGHVRCGGGTGSALSLAVNLPYEGDSRVGPSAYIILEQVPARGAGN